jgi:hypothetical protein
VHEHRFSHANAQSIHSNVGVTPRVSNPHDYVDHIFKRHYELLEFKIGIQNSKLSSLVYCGSLSLVCNFFILLELN